MFAFHAHSRTSHAHSQEDDDGGLEAEELPEEVVEVLNKVNLKVEHFDINTDDDDSSENIKKKEDTLIKKMKGKLNPSSGWPTQPYVREVLQVR